MGPILNLLGRLFHTWPRRKQLEDTLPLPSALSPERIRQLQRLEEKLGYRFRELRFLDLALTHKSFPGDSPGPQGAPLERRHYESLEFLGDAILGFVVSELLYRNFSEASEGDLSKMRAHLVSTTQLHAQSKQLRLGDFLRLGHGEEKTGGREKKAILADLFESVTAGIYLDGGLEATRRFLFERYQPQFELLAWNTLPFRDFKSNLQELLHALDLPGPKYQVVQESGPDHRKEFVVEVRFSDRQVARARGKSKKEAEQRAARQAIDILGTGDERRRGGP